MCIDCGLLLSQHVIVDAGAGGRTSVKSLPVLVNADGLPLGVSFSEARNIITLDGHVLVSLPTAPNDTLTLKITALEGYLHAFSSSHVVGDGLLVGSTRDCVYQVTVIGDARGQGFTNLCDNLVSTYIITVTIMTYSVASGVQLH